jgi:hypothetical protein
MTEENKDVNQTEANQSTPSTDKEQVSQDQGEVKPEESKQADIHSNLQRAIEQEKDKLRKLREQRREIVSQPKTENEDESDEDKKWRMQQEAKTDVAIKLASDPSFKERQDLVMEEMNRSGKALEDADALVKSRLFDEVLKSSAPSPTPSYPNQINPSATPEQTPVNRNWNIDDVIAGKASTGNIALDNSLRFYKNGSPNG